MNGHRLNNMYRPAFALFLFLAPAHFLFASVSISEVAWMGSTESANHEWIELYNSSESISVEGWTLSDGANLTITLAGTIPGSSYAVLERNRSDGSSVVSSPFLNYAGALVNTGATLTLRRADGSLVDSVSGGENWQSIGGDNTTKDTAQYTTSGWITGVPTPGQANTTDANPSPASTTGSSSSSANSSRTILTSTTNQRTAQVESVPEALSLQVVVPDFIYAGQPVSFTVVPNGMTSTIRNSLKYQWNFGDLHTSTSSSPTHVFSYPGTYNVFVEGRFAGYSASARREIAVLPLTVSMSHSEVGDVLLQNDAMYEVDISNYYLAASQVKRIPSHTYISPRETITIPWPMLSQSAFPPTVLLGRGKEIITSTYAKAEESSIVTASVVSAPVAIAPTVTFREPEIVTEVQESLISPSAFGFAAAEASESDILVSDEVVIMEEGGEEVIGGDASGVTPLLTSSTTANSDSLPVSTWWTYGLLALILISAIATLRYRPKV